ncbi:hypothetical protein ACWN83_07275 [Pseudolactococcus plantarum]|uniref:Uncharacterized protein n=1 Tax=Pseudolactococcus plantarum TaxID=1365 RepID=A0A2A5RXY2_9LACT|nr:hypothetical protein [Lactococcus plantarum]PCS06107.1 hypothetical protein RU87_GL000303 [Lactococcus plantarum]HCN75036.1 hypothetical protein [Lactococcus sp.]
MLTYDEALQKLKLIVKNSNSYTLTDLEQLIRQISIDDPIANGNATTVLYSGMVKPGVHSNKIIQEIYNRSDVRVIDRTHIGQFLLSPEYEIALEAAYINTYLDVSPSKLESAIGAYLYGGESRGTTGPWAEASKRFAQNTEGSENPLVTSSEMKLLIFK